jgi:hypothetical protein
MKCLHFYYWVAGKGIDMKTLLERVIRWAKTPMREYRCDICNRIMQFEQRLENLERAADGKIAFVETEQCIS